MTFQGCCKYPTYPLGRWSSFSPPDRAGPITGFDKEDTDPAGTTMDQSQARTLRKQTFPYLGRNISECWRDHSRSQRWRRLQGNPRGGGGGAMAEALRKFMEAVGRDPRGRPQGQPQGHGKGLQREESGGENQGPGWVPRDMPPAWPQLSTPSNLRHLCRK